MATSTVVDDRAFASFESAIESSDEIVPIPSLANLSLSETSTSARPTYERTNVTPDERLIAAAREDSPELIAQALAAGATSIDTAMFTALDGACIAALYYLLQRGALARTIGVLPSLLHRPGVPLQQRVDAAALLLSHIATSHSVHAYRASVHDVLLAGACLREGPLILAQLVSAGHLETCFREAGSRESTLKEALKLAGAARRISWASGGSQDAVVCGLVRTTIRKHYSGYDLARQQIQLCLDGLHTVGWAPRVHRSYPPPFRQHVRQLLLLARRPPLSGLDEDMLFLVIAHVAWSTYWGAPAIDLDEGEEIDFRRRYSASSRQCAPLGGGAAREERSQAPATKFVERLNRFVPIKSERRAPAVHQASYYAGK